MDERHVRTVLTAEIAKELAMAPEDVDGEASFMRLGVSSVQALKIVNRLRRDHGMDVNPVALFEFKTVDDMADHLAQEAGDYDLAP